MYAEVKSVSPAPLGKNSTVKNRRGTTQTEQNRKWACSFPDCGYRARDNCDLKKHGRKHEVAVALRNPFPCTFAGCEYRAGLEITLRRHVKAKHETCRKKEFQCAMCPSKFFTRDGLRFHIPNHVKEKRFKCTRCPFVTHSRSSLTRHVRTVHEKSVKYPCSHSGCNFVAVRSETLKRHAQTHERDSAVRLPFACTFPDCSYRGRGADSVTRHIQVNHNKDRTRDITCPLCPQTFWDKCAMRSHIKNIHTKEKDRKCSECDFVTRMSSALQHHFKRKHGGGYFPPRNAKCELCFFRGKDKHDLTQHKIQFHETEPSRQLPFECSIPTCDFRSRTKTSAVHHERLHVSKKRLFLRCELCPEKLYPNWDSVRFHQWLVHDRRAHRCPVCSFVARKKPNLEKHVRFHHYRVGVQARQKSTIIPHRAANQVDVLGTNNGVTDTQVLSQAGNRVACKLEGEDKCSALKFQRVAVVLLRKIMVKVM